MLGESRGVGVGDEAAERVLAGGVELHVEGDGAAGLGPAADVVELEAHEGLHQGALAVGLVAHHQHRRGVERRVELLGQPVKLVVRLVQARLAAAAAAAAVLRGFSIAASAARHPRVSFLAFCSSLLTDFEWLLLLLLLDTPPGRHV